MHAQVLDEIEVARHIETVRCQVRTREDAYTGLVVAQSGTAQYPTWEQHESYLKDIKPRELISDAVVRVINVSTEKIEIPDSFVISVFLGRCYAFEESHDIDRGMEYAISTIDDWLCGNKTERCTKMLATVNVARLGTDMLLAILTTIPRVGKTASARRAFYLDVMRRISVLRGQAFATKLLTKYA